MIRNYFKIALRNFSKHKLFATINIFGLALGMSVCLLALSISVAIIRSDEFHVNKDRIYQINTNLEDATQKKSYESVFHATGKFLNENYPFIQETVNIRQDFHPTIDHFGFSPELKGYYVEKSFTSVFSFKMLAGDPASALENPFSLVLTQKAASTLFGEEDPMGKTVKTEVGEFLVTGIIENPRETHFHFQMLTSMETYRRINGADYDNNWSAFRNNYIYVLLKEGVDRDALDEALAELSRTAMFFNEDKKISFESVLLTDVVPQWDKSNAIGIGWDYPSMIFFIAIGLLVLLPAIFNYTNLSIARALKRAREIGIRKVVGAERRQIKAQFLIEAILTVFVALILSLIILAPMKREFLSMIVSAEVLNTDFNFYQISTFVIFALLVGLVAGIFPARYFAAMNPVETIYGKVSNGTTSVSGFRKGLFVFQFVLSLFFITGVVTLLSEHRYVLNADFGFTSDNVLSVPIEKIDKKLIVNELRKHPDVSQITTASDLPGTIISSQVEVTANDKDSLMVGQIFIGDSFTENMGISFTWGSDELLEESNSNTEYVLVNNQFLKSMSVFNGQADSLRFRLADGTNCVITGIIEDLNIEPISEYIRPVLLRYSVDESRYALITLRSEDIRGTLSELESIWTSVDQKVRFEPVFLNDEIEKMYHYLMVQIKFFSVLSVLAISIACLGLLGMVSFTTENRTKEIAIRKIMGASDKSLFLTLTRDFVKLILIATVIAVPLSYFFYDIMIFRLLLHYGTGMGILEIVASVLLLFLIGFGLLYGQTSAIVKANPASNLKYE